MPGVYSSQGTLVFFNGVRVGYIVDFEVVSSASGVVETTNVTNVVIGVGASSRLLKSFDCLSVEPPSIAINVRGMPTTTPYDIGTVGILEFSSSEGFFTGAAILVDWRYAGRVNETTAGSVTFKLNGVMA